tara:strand:- start:1256 stop:1882 length:627 start_codon:yes stop_codon:yes gene_type:complete
MTYVYLKTQSYTGTNLSQNTIPLNVVSAGISVSKTIPAFPIPLSGVATGESITTAFDLGMASKSVNLSGFIQDAEITKTFGGGDNPTTTETHTFTAQEIAQMIASGVDSTGFAKKQAFSELVILIPSNVDADYNTRGTLGTLIPLTFGSRGDRNEKDNEGVPLPLTTFPDSSTDVGLTGFIRSFSFNLEAESTDVSFSLDFEVATVIP